MVQCVVRWVVRWAVVSWLLQPCEVEGLLMNLDLMGGYTKRVHNDDYVIAPSHNNKLTITLSEARDMCKERGDRTFAKWIGDGFDEDLRRAVEDSCPSSDRVLLNLLGQSSSEGTEMPVLIRMHDESWFAASEKEKMDVSCIACGARKHKYFFF